MGDFIDLTGQRFGKLVVIKKGEPHITSGGAHITTWYCKCDCGNYTTVQSQKLRNGHTTSCGCFIKENKGHAFENLVGKKFNRLTVIKFIPQNERTVRGYNWLCQCECGKMIKANASKLKSGMQQSCGCLKEEMKYNIGNVNKKYKYTNKRLYGIYKAMLSRCYDTKGREYNNYGGRGITVCEEWLGEYGYDVFAEWALSTGYDINAKHGDCTIDRVDVNKGYSPDNCTWKTNKQQQNNKRTNHLITYNGETHNLKEWSEILSISYSKICYHVIRRKRTIQEMLDISG